MRSNETRLSYIYSIRASATWHGIGYIENGASSCLIKNNCFIARSRCGKFQLSFAIIQRECPSPPCRKKCINQLSKWTPIKIIRQWCRLRRHHRAVTRRCTISKTQWCQMSSSNGHRPSRRTTTEWPRSEVFWRRCRRNWRTLSSTSLAPLSCPFPRELGAKLVYKNIIQ